MSDFFDAFAYAPQPVSGRGALSRREVPYERSFIERVFAPFEAPQQGLFSLTTGIAEDGFQLRDLWDSFGHAARYFNPWSNEKPIEADEIRRIFMGNRADGQRGFARLGTNLAISLLYDPLLLTGVAKGLKLVEQGTRGARALSLVTNPAEEVINATRYLSVQAGNQAKVLARNALGETKAEIWGTRLAQYTVNRYAGVPDALRQKVLDLDQRITSWRQEGFNVMKKAEKLRGPETQRILAEALESEAVWLQRSGKALNREQAGEWGNIQRRLRQTGVSEDLFFQVYDRARKLDDTIGEGLWKLGLIDRKDMELYQGVHLRRQFAAFEKPLDYIDRIEALIATRPDLAPDITRTSVRALRQNLRDLGDDVLASARDFHPLRPDELKDLGRVAADGDATALGGIARWFSDVRSNRYFDPANGNRLNSEAFAQDLIDWVGKNSDATVDDIFTHIQTEMLGNLQMGARFWESIGNHLSGARYTSKGLQSYVNKLEDMAIGHGQTWRAIQERMEIVAKRENLRPEIREALGEVLEAAPRIAGQASDAGRLLEMRAFLDDLAGVKRVSEEAGTLLRSAKRMIEQGQDVPPELLGQITEKLGRAPTPEDIIRLDTGAVLGIPSGSALASPNKTAKHTVRVPPSPSFGELGGMYMTPGAAMLIRRLEGVGDITNPTSRLAFQTAELLRKGTGHFKVMKVVMDPTAQFRNFIGNMVLMDMQGTNPLRVDKLIKAFGEVQQLARTGKPGKYLQLAEDAGVSIFQSTFSRQELQEFAQFVSREPIDRRTWKGVAESIFDGIGKVYKNSTEVGMKVFETSEQTFKLDVFIDQYEKLASNLVRSGKRLTPEIQKDLARQAGALAEQALFNYADVPYLIDFARKYGVVPFATFPFKAAPYVAETLYKHPHRVLKYHRTVDEINRELAGSPEDVAREVQALPEHLRQSLVAKMPFSDDSGRPLYVDLSYFLPWYVIQDLKEQAVDPAGAFLTGQSRGDVGDYGLRDGVLTPPVLALLDAFRRNEDSLGQPIWKPEMSSSDKLMAFGRFLGEFWMPPSMPGLGSRSDSIGRAMQAVAANDPSISDWVDRLGGALRLNTGQDQILPRPGMTPQTQAQVGLGGDAGAIGGAFLGLFGGMAASDRTQSALNARGAMQSSATEIARQIARIRSNPTLSPSEKRERIGRLRASLLETRQETSDYFSSL